MENKIKMVMLIGITGYGKTTLFNRLTGTNERVQLGTKSITSTIIKRKSKLEYFEVLDTPGQGSDLEKLKNIGYILESLKQTEIHRIILVIKHDRIVQMIQQIKSIFKFFKNYKENITIYISHYEFFQGDVNGEKLLKQTRIKNELKIDSVIYSEGASTDESIIEQINYILQSRQQLSIFFSIDEIIECFDLFNLNQCESMEQLKENLNTQFSIRVDQPIMSFIENFPKQIDDPLYLNYLHELSKFAKQKAQKCFEQFCEIMENQFQVNNVNNSQYVLYDTFKKTLKLKQSQMIFKIYEKKRGHPKIKACPHCGLLQVKENEESRILCGESERYFYANSKFNLLKFEYKIINNQVKLIENDIQLFKDKDELIQELKCSFNNKQFEQIIQKFNIKYDHEFIQLLMKEFGKYCFDYQIKVIDKRNYNEFIKTLTELLIESLEKPQEKQNEVFGCGNYFYWEQEILGLDKHRVQSQKSNQIEDFIKKRVVLIGTLGYGKTTLFNRLTGAQENISQGPESTIKYVNLRLSKAEPLEKQFEVVDTPGLGSSKDKIQNIAGILAALTQNVVHRIIFVIRHERTDLMISQIRSIFEFFKNYKENTTIYISYFDQFEGDVNKEKQLIQTKIQNEFNINSFIYYEKQSDASIIKQINQILVTSQPMQIQFSIEQIIKRFDIFVSPNYNQFQIDIDKLVKNYRQNVYSSIINFLDNFPKQLNDSLYLNYLEELQNFTKQKVEELIEQFINEYGEQMNNEFEVNSYNSQYAPYIKYQQHMMSLLSSIINKIIEKKQLHPDLIGNKIKACPNCGLLWVKEYDCNKILCGERAGKFSPSLKLKPLVKFEYKIENYQVILIEKDIQWFKSKDELIDELKNSFNNGQFKQILEQINIKHDYELIELFQKEFGKSCFNQWIQMIDKRNYNEFVQTLVQLLQLICQNPKEGTKGKFGCGKYFY